MNQLAHFAVLSAAPTQRRRRTDRLLDVASRIRKALRRVGAFPQSIGGQDRPDARSRQPRTPSTQAPVDAMSILVGESIKGLGRRDPGERDEARAMLVQLAVRRGHEGAKRALESNLTTAIWDFDLPTLLFLAKNAEPRIASAVDTSLEHNMERLENEQHLNTLTYIAAKSTCSIDARRRAAKILEKQERRTENLEYVQSHTDDIAIRTLMTAALEERQHHK